MMDIGLFDDHVLRIVRHYALTPVGHLHIADRNPLVRRWGPAGYPDARVGASEPVHRQVADRHVVSLDDEAVCETGWVTLYPHILPLGVPAARDGQALVHGDGAHVGALADDQGVATSDRDMVDGGLNVICQEIGVVAPFHRWQPIVIDEVLTRVGMSRPAMPGAHEHGHRRHYCHSRQSQSDPFHLPPPY